MTDKKRSSSADILGKPKPIKDLTNLCCMCNKVIPAERIKALTALGMPPHRWTHTKCSTTTKIKGIYLGEVGTSEIKLCDKIYNDSVRNVFKKAESDDDSDETE